MADAATMVVDLTATMEKPKRTRKTHHKVRSGCITCKIRRKKCDEAKPECKRCTTTGRKCDGYEDQPKPPSAAKTIPTRTPGSNSPDSGIDVSFNHRTKSSSPRSSRGSESDDPDRTMMLWRPPKTTHFNSDHDYYCFDFFRNRTGPEFAAYFDSSIWRTFIMRACFLHPTVLQAAAAVGAVHRRFELGITPEAFTFCGIAHRQYKKAVQCLEQDRVSNHPSAPEISMLSHFLLAIFETFQTNYAAALSHMTTGLTHILSRPHLTTHSESTYKAVQVGYSPLHTFLTQLETLSTQPHFFGTFHTTLSDPALDVQPTPIPHVFTSLDQARDILFSESLWIWHAWHSLTLGTNDGFTAQHTHIARLLSWSTAYAEYTKTLPASHHTLHPTSQSSSHLLKTYREALYLILLTQMALHEPDTGAEIVPLCFPPETCDCHRSCRDYAERKSALNAHFARLLVFGDGLEKDSPFGYKGMHSLSVDSGIGPPLWAGNTRCRSTKVRHQVTSVLMQGQRVDEGELWKEMGVYSVAEKLSSVEEHAVVAAGGLSGWTGGWKRKGKGGSINGAVRARDGIGEVSEEEEGGWFRGQPNWMVGKVGLGEPKWVDFTCFMEEGRLLVRYCREDEVGGLVWTQEWVTFR